MKFNSTFQSILEESFSDFETELLISAVETIQQVKLRFAFAESLTGGLLSHFFYSIQEINTYYTGGIFCPNIITRINLLGLSAETLRNKGENSKDAALETAIGVKRLFKSDIGIASTGFINIDPKAVNSENAYTVNTYIAFAFPKRQSVKRFKFNGYQREIKLKIIHAILQNSVNLLKDHLNY